MKPKYPRLLVLTLLSVLLLSGCGADSDPTPAEPVIKDSGEKPVTIVTSFYPMYIFALNVTKDIPGVQVVNLTKQTAGDLHDYALTPEDMKKLEGANILIVNGAGLESFLAKAVQQMPNLKVITASEGIELLEGESHSEDEPEEAGPEQAGNPHVWVSIGNAIKQVQTIGSQLALLDPENAKDYERNTKEYLAKLEQQQQKMHQALDKIQNRQIITFHEAFPYFAKEFNLTIAGVVQREPGSEPNAKELRETIETVKRLNIKALFAEPQYPASAANTIANETGAKVYILDPVATGPMEADAYVNIMDNNLKTLLEALQ